MFEYFQYLLLTWRMYIHIFIFAWTIIMASKYERLTSVCGIKHVSKSRLYADLKFFLPYIHTKIYGNSIMIIERACGKFIQKERFIPFLFLGLPKELSGITFQFMKMLPTFRLMQCLYYMLEKVSDKNVSWVC